MFERIEKDVLKYPNLTYTRDLQVWHEFIRRTPEEYCTWKDNVKKECEILTRINSKDSYNALKNSGFKVIFRDENRSQEETVKPAEEVFGI